MKKEFNFRSALLRPCNLLILTLVNVLIFSACTRGDDTIANTLKAATITNIETPSHDKATITWETATDSETPFDELRYQVLWNVKGSTEVKNSGEPKTALFSYTITGLTEKTTYRVWVRVWNKAGNRAEYPAKEFTTPVKKEEPKPEPKPEPEDPTAHLDVTNYLQLTTEKKVGETVSLLIDAKEADRKGVWLDLNNNGKYEKEIDVLPTDFKTKAVYTLKAQTFRVYGKVIELTASENRLTAFESHQPYLEILDLYTNNLTTLTLNQPVLSKLELSYNRQLSTLNLNTPNLSILYVMGNIVLKTIDTRQFPKLKWVNISFSFNIETLDLSQNPKLTVLNASSTKLTSLNLSKNPELGTLFVASTPLTALDVTANTKLNYVSIANSLKGTALTNFINMLPNRKGNKNKGKIYLSPEQKTEAVVNYLQSKNWEIQK